MSHQIKLDEKNTDILKLLSEGVPVKAIAERVFLSYAGVRYRIAELKQRTGAKNTTELVCYFFEHIKELKKAG